MVQKVAHDRIESLVLGASVTRARHPRALAAGCVAMLAAILALEIVTPDDVVAGMTLVPLIAAMWALPHRLAIVVAAAGGLFFAIAVVFDQGNRLSLLLLAVPALATAAVVRLNAVGLARAATKEQPPARIPPPLSTRPNAAFVKAPLTRRELEVARLAACAYTAAEIARELHIGERTVESHIAATYMKLGIRCRSELIRMASLLG